MPNLQSIRLRSKLLVPLLAIAALAQLLLADNPAQSQPQSQPRPRPADEPQTQLRQPLPPPTLPLRFLENERVALVGNSLAERMNLFGHFETALHLRTNDRRLVVRNFARPADEVAVRQRPNDYTLIDDPQKVFTPDTYLCFFGFNESFAGDHPEALAEFKRDYHRYLDETAAKYPRPVPEGQNPAPRFVLVSPVAFEPPGDPLLPDGDAENARLRAYGAAVAEVAAERGIPFVDVMGPTHAAFHLAPGLQYTINGAHLDENGDKLLAKILVDALLGKAPGDPDPAADPRHETLRAAVVDKAWVHLQDYRMLNGWYVYGGRRTWDTETFPREFKKLREMAALRDRRVWEIAAGNLDAPPPDDSDTTPLLVPPTRFGDPRQKYSEADDLRYLTPEQFIASTRVAEGTELRLFADETRFPDLANPVQLDFDEKGRLWVACMPTYPQWRPGDPKPNDKLLILEDLDGDGLADKSTVFYDKLHCPTGFEFWNGGVLVVDQPRILWLKDEDGDDRADTVVHLLDGVATDDTHHTMGAFEWSHGGLLHMLEGIATSTTIETPRGPHRSLGSGGAYVLDPRSLRIRQFVLPGQYNSWCYVFDGWGQGVVGDGTTAAQHWDTLYSTKQYPGRKGAKTIFDNQGMRPALGSEFLVSRALPEHLQGQLTYACVINMNGLPRFTVRDDGAGFAGERLKFPDGSPDDLVRSSDKHFRPACPTIGPDGALWFGDWSNALIGHMQYSQRDPNRDHARGRVYRLVAKDKPLLQPVTQHGKSAAELLEQLREPEWRTRYRVRRALRDKNPDELLPALRNWLAAIPENDPERERLRTEALWLLQSRHILDQNLLRQVLASPEPRARAAAVRSLDDMARLQVPGTDLENLLPILRTAANDPHPRVRAEAVRALSFIPDSRAVALVLEAARLPMDEWLRYLVDAALGANEELWRTEYLTGKLPLDDAPEVRDLLDQLLVASKAGGAAAPHLRVLLANEPRPEEERNKAIAALLDLKGNPGNGREVLVRNCTACHRVGNGEGQDYGPNLGDVAKRLTKAKILESILDPNAEVDPKYLTTRLLLDDGRTLSGLLVEETPDTLVVFDGKDRVAVPLEQVEERQTLKQSSMPEGLAATMSPAEFLDLLEYLDSRK